MSFFSLTGAALPFDDPFAHKHTKHTSLAELQQGGRVDSVVQAQAQPFRQFGRREADGVRCVEFVPVHVIREGGRNNVPASIEVVRALTDADAHDDADADVHAHRLWVVKLSSRASAKMSRDMNAHLHIIRTRRAEHQLGYAFLMDATCICLDDTLALLMPLAMVDLRDYLRRVDGEYRDRARRFIAQIALAIATLHSIGIVHGDLKPENVLIDYKENVKLVDFGSCILKAGTPLTEKTLVMPVAEFDDEYKTILPYSDSFLDYSVGPASDYWALGCMAYELETAVQTELTEEQRCNNVLFDRKTMKLWLTEHPFYLGQATDWDAFRKMLPDVGKNLDKVSLSLLAGLLSPLRQSRSSIEDLLSHAYFLRDDSTSEFEMLEYDLERPELCDARLQNACYHAEPLKEYESYVLALGPEQLGA